MTITVEYLGY